MSTTNTGTQTIVFDYKHPTEGKEFNQLLRGAIKPGIYKGGKLSIVNTSTASISPFVVFLNVDGVNGDNKVVRIETSQNISISVSSSNPVIYMSYSWLDTALNYADFGIRAITDPPETNEIRFGLATFTESSLTGFNTSPIYKDYGTLDENYDTYIKSLDSANENFHTYDEHQINSVINDNSKNEDATFEVKRLDDETQTHRDVAAFTLEETITLGGSNHGLVAGDYIQISNASIEANDGEYRINKVDGAILTIDKNYKKVDSTDGGALARCAKLVNAKLTWDENQESWLAGYEGEDISDFYSKLVTQKNIGSNILHLQTIDDGLEKNDPVYFDTTVDIVDSCTTADWTDDGEMTSSANTTTYLLDSALNLTKDAGASATASTHKTVTTLNFTDKELVLYLYIDDSTTFSTLTSSTCLTIRYGSDDSNYYQWQLDKSELSLGWNTIKDLTSLSADSTQGSPSITALDYLYIGLTANNAGDTWAAGKVIMDHWYLKSDEKWKKSTNLTPTPQGVYIGNSGVVLDGYTYELNSLIPNYVYYMDSSGNLTPKVSEAYNNTKILYSLSDNEAIVDIDIEESDLNILTYKKGYIMGGNDGSLTTVIEDLTFPSETSQTISATLDTAKSIGTGIDSLTKGYILGGDTGSKTAVIEDLTFYNENSQTISATLDTAKYGGAGVNSITKGYCMGGDTGAVTDVIEDLIFSDESSQAISATLDTAKWAGVGVSSSSKGYCMGGNTAVSETNVIEDLIFSDESSQAISATLDTAKYYGAGVNSSTKGYIMGGDDASPFNVIEDLIFSDESSQAISATLDAAKGYSTGTNSSSKGYCMGGGFVGSKTDVIEDLIFSNESSQVIAATLDTAKHLGTGVNTLNG